MKKADTSKRQARSQVTQKALMRAAEKLIADHGIGNVSIRAIVSKAGQKNESALQYHFKNLNGLIQAIHDERSAQTRALRTKLLAELSEQTRDPSLRQLCTLMLQPAFELARSKADFRNYIKAFGHELVLTRTSPLSMAASQGAGGASGYQLGTLLKNALPHLNDEAYIRRMDAAIRLCAASVYQHVRQKKAFRGPESDLFLQNLIDALVGLLNASVSDETSMIERSLSRS